MCLIVKPITYCVHNNMLNWCSGAMVPGVNAIMGPTGGGKTT